MTTVSTKLEQVLETKPQRGPPLGAESQSSLASGILSTPRFRIESVGSLEEGARKTERSDFPRTTEAPSHTRISSFNVIFIHLLLAMGEHVPSSPEPMAAERRS